MSGFKQVFELQDKHTKGDQLSDFIAVNHVRHGIVDWDKKNLPSIMHSIRTAVAAKIL